MENQIFPLTPILLVEIRSYESVSQEHAFLHIRSNNRYKKNKLKALFALEPDTLFADILSKGNNTTQSNIR
jgi:hypothetical protein